MAVRPGDVAFQRGGGFGAWLIRVGTSSRYNHVRLVIDYDGTCVESVGDGVVYGKVKPDDVVTSPPNLTDEQRDLIRPIAENLLGTPYGYIDLVAIALAQLGINLPYLKKRIERPDRLFCSQLVDYVWLLAGYHAFDDGRMSQNVSPGDLADLSFRNGWPSVLATTEEKTSAGGGAKLAG